MKLPEFWVFWPWVTFDEKNHDFFFIFKFYAENDSSTQFFMHFWKELHILNQKSSSILVIFTFSSIQSLLFEPIQWKYFDQKRNFLANRPHQKLSFKVSWFSCYFKSSNEIVISAMMQKYLKTSFGWGRRAKTLRFWWAIPRPNWLK